MTHQIPPDDSGDDPWEGDPFGPAEGGGVVAAPVLQPLSAPRRNGSRKAANQTPDQRAYTCCLLRERAEDLLCSLELVFHQDWAATACNLGMPEEHSSHTIAPGGTFLEPGVPDECNNWANRGSLLRAYRKLRAVVYGDVDAALNLDDAVHARCTARRP